MTLAVSPRELSLRVEIMEARVLAGNSAVNLAAAKTEADPEPGAIEHCPANALNNLKQFTARMEIRTRGKGLYPFTRQVAEWVASTGTETGLLTVFLQHTSASLVIQENADPDVTLDLKDFFETLAPENELLYRHATEGPDDMPAHIRAALTPSQLSVPVIGARMALGTWQGIYVFEHRTEPQRRSVVLHLIGESNRPVYCFYV